MAAFINGSGDLGSTTMESAFVELLLRAQIEDQGLQTPTGRFTDDIAANGATQTVNATIPVSLSLASGKPQFTATDVLGVAFNPGTSGTLVSTNYPAAILELATKIQELERAQSKAVVNFTYDADAGIVTISATFTMTRSVEPDGSQMLVPTVYLT